MKIIFNTTTRVIRGPYSGAELPTAGEAEREITAQEFDMIDTIHRAGNVAVDDLAGIRVATLDEADDKKTFRQSMLDRIKLIANLANRAAAYQGAPAILLALENQDKPGAKAVVDTLTTFSQTVRDRLKALIDAIIFP